MLKLFFFATILVQGFEIKVENSRVVSFLLCRCRGSLCRDIGWECHIAALLDILAIAITQKRTASNTLSMSAKNFCQMDASCFFLSLMLVMSSLTLSGRAWQQLWEKVHRQLKTKIICVEKNSDGNICPQPKNTNCPNIAIIARGRFCTGACNGQQCRQFAFRFSNGSGENTIHIEIWTP